MTYEEFHDLVESLGYRVSTFQQDYRVSFVVEEDVFDEAYVVAEVEVKWDECSNWSLNRSDGIMHHFCSRDGIENFSKVLLACHDYAMSALGHPSP